MTKFKDFDNEISEEINSLILLKYPKLANTYSSYCLNKDKCNDWSISQKYKWIVYYILYLNSIPLENLFSCYSRRVNGKLVTIFAKFYIKDVSKFLTISETSSEKVSKIFWKITDGPKQTVSSSSSPFIIPEKILKELI